MIRNYFLVAVRNLARNKFFSALNIFGLAVSMTISMAIIMVVADQMTYDRHNSKHGRIYRINSYMVDNHGKARGGIDNATSPMPLRQEFLDKYTGIEKSVRIKRGFGNNWLELEHQNVNIPLKGFFADAEALELFECQLQYGDPSTALKEPYSLVLTRKAADKLFDKENPLGLSIKVGDLGTYTVTGVLKETSNKSHLVFEGLASMSTVDNLRAQGKPGNDLDNWMDFWGGWNYVLLEEGKSAEDIQPALDKIYDEHVATNPNPDAYRAKFHLQSLTGITPGPLVNNAIGPSLPWPVVYFLGGLAAVIMLTSCFNFTNLSVARSLKRAKEIGVRKATGALRLQIFAQFLMESVVVTCCALVLAFALLMLLKPLILQLTFARLFMWNFAFNYQVACAFILLALGVGICAGFFPAVVLSGFQPVKVLKGGLSTGKILTRIGLRKTLLVSQFTISLIFILTVIVMYNQLALFLGNDYGFNMSRNMMVKLNNTSADVLKNELLKYPGIENVTATSHVPAAGETHENGFKKQLPDKEWTYIHTFAVDADYLKNMEVRLVAGKFFPAEQGASNRNFIVINEQAAKALHYDTPPDALGEEIIYQNDSSRKVVIGVVKD